MTGQHVVERANVCICGCGIAGVATAYYLVAQGQPADEVLLIDGRPPLSLTTAASGENFRDHWPQPCMRSLSEHSIELMQRLARESEPALGLRFSGYDYVSESEGPEVFAGVSSGKISQFSDPGLLRQVFPYLAGSIRQVVRYHYAGAMDVQALGSRLLAGARQAGVRLLRTRVDEIRRQSGRFVLSVGGDGSTVTARSVVLAAGPFIDSLAAGLGLALPVDHFLQRKIIIPDPDQVVPRNMPFTIFADPQRLDWSDDERELLDDDPDHRWLLEEMPPGLHVKPESTRQIKLGWAYNRKAEIPVRQPPVDPAFASVVLRGASRFLPGLGPYVERIPTPVVQYAGYYTRTEENWPLIGPLDLDGLFVIGALSGFGTMCACAAGELCADWIIGRPLPAYAGHFHPGRYSDPQVMAEIRSIEADGQL